MAGSLKLDRGRCAEKTVASDLEPRSGTYQEDACRELVEELREIGDRLRIAVDAVEENPSSLDRAMLNAPGHVTGIEAVIVDVYRVMKDRVYGSDSSLWTHGDIRDAFKEQEDEFIDFYRSALKALEIYKEVLRAYRFLKDQAVSMPRRGDLQRIRQDEHAHKDERDECIAILCDYRDKYSAMLAILSSAG